MSQEQAVMLIVCYAIGTFVTLGMLLAGAQQRGREAGIGDVVSALLWPALVFVVIGASCV